MVIHKEGKVQIGDVPINTSYPYKLYVQSGIITEKLKVANHQDINWADFVFKDDYKLAGLYEVENFIKENKHLPGIPSEADVKRDGIDVAEMDARLLQKIEELTLYIIKLQKEVDVLKANNRK
jgi:hypothetical protein